MTTQLLMWKKRVRLRISLQGTPVELAWSSVVGTLDPTTGSVIGTATPGTETTKGLFHRVNLAQTQIKLFAQYEAGDAIVDLLPEVELEGKDSLLFMIDGEVWIQKQGEGKPIQHWEQYMGTRLYRSVLLRKQT